MYRINSSRDTGQTLAPAFAEAVPQVAVGQFHHDDELAIDDAKLFQRQDIGMANAFNAFERLGFLLGGAALLIDVVEIAENKLRGFQEPARRLDFPHLPKAAATKTLYEPVALERTGQFFLANQANWHD